MNRLSPSPSPGFLRVLLVSILSFAILTMPFAPAMAAAAAVPLNTTKDAKSSSNASSNEALENRLFVNKTATPLAPEVSFKGATADASFGAPPNALFVPAGAVTAIMTATLINDDGDTKLDPTNGNPATTEQLKYSVTLDNQSGSDATNLSFGDTIDPHTTLVPGSIQSTPVAFDLPVPAFDEDPPSPIPIILKGQDPDGSNVTFSIVSQPSHATTTLTPTGTTCAANGVCTATVSYTPTANYNGTDSFTFKVNDGAADSNQNGTVSININAVNDAPTFTVPASNPPAVNEDSGAQTVASYITNVSPGPANESSQTVSFVITNNTNPSLFLSGPSLNVAAPGGPFPTTASLTYTSASNQNGTAVITYHLHDNGGGTAPNVDNSADQTFTITVNAVNDKPVVTAPTGIVVQANMKRTGLGGLLASITDADAGVNGCVPTPFKIKSGSISATTPAGGTITNVDLNNGTFDFDPPPGFTGGPVTFTYVVTDNGCPGTADSDPVTVSIAVQGPVIWFVNPALGANGDGRLSNPFNTLVTAADLSHLGNQGTNQRVFVYSGTTALNAGVTLYGAATQTLAQWLIGQGVVGTDFDTVMGISPPSNTIARPSVSTAATSTANRPIIRGNVIMKDNSVVRGLNIDVSAAAANTKGLSASTLGAGSVLAISDVNVTSAAGNAVDFNNAQTVNYATSDSTNSPNILSSGSGIAISVVSTTIGASGMTFKSISSNGATNGIVLNGTGSNPFVVTGDGTNTTQGGNGTGGTIQNSTGADGSTANNGASNGVGIGIFLKNASNVSLRRMTISKASNFAIEAENVSGITLQYCKVNNGGSGTNGDNGAQDEGSVRFLEATGTDTIDNCDISGGYEDNIRLDNNAGTLTNFVISNNKIHDNQDASNSNHGILMDFEDSIAGAVVATTHITGNTFFNNHADHIHIGSSGGANSNNETINIIITGNNATGERGTDVGGGIAITSANFDGNVNYNVSSNTMQGTHQGGAILISQGATNVTSSTQGFFGHVDNNIIGVSGVAFSGTTQSSAIRVENHGNAIHNAVVNNNQLRRFGNAGIEMQTGGTGFDSGKLDITITNNIIAETSATSAGSGVPNGVHLNAGTNPVNATQVCLDLKNNTLAGSGVNSAVGEEDFRLRQRQATTVRLPGYGGANNSNAAVVTFEQGQNTGPETGSAANTVGFTAGAGGFVGGAACAQPPAALTMNQPQTNRLDDLAQLDNLFQNSDADSLAAFLNIKTDFSSISEEMNNLTQSAPTQLTADNTQPAQLIAAAENIVNNKALFVQASDTASTAGVDSKSDSNKQTAIKATASGRVWSDIASDNDGTRKAERADALFVSGNDSSQYGARIAKASYQPVADMRAGSKVVTTASNRDSMLSHGSSRRAKQINHAATVQPILAPPTPPPGVAFPVNGTGSGFLLPNGKTVTITFKVTLNNPPGLSGVPPATPQVSNHGTLTGGFPTNPLDTNTITTNVDLFNTTTSLASSSPGSSNLNQSVTFTATIAFTGSNSPAPASGSPAGTVAFKDGGTAISGCAAVSVTSSQAQCTTSSLSNGAHPTITAEYSGDGSYDPSTSGAISQTVSKSNTTTAVTSSPNPSLVTQNVTFTATVTSAGGFAGPPTGTVTFKDNGTTITCSNVSQALSSGVATCQTSSLDAAGSPHSITAFYPGDTNFNSSDNTASPFMQTVNKSDTTTTITSATPNPSTPGQQVKFVASVSSATIVGPPTGTVDFLDGATPICSGVARVSGQWTCQTTTLSEATHSITAKYNADATFNTSTSAPVSQVVSKNSTTTTLASSKPQSAPTETVTFTATVSPTAATGTVTFTDSVSGPVICENGSTSVQTLSGGTATCQFTYPDTTGSPHHISAQYNGDSTYSGSTSNTVDQVVSSCTSTQVVTNTADTGAGSLRQAIAGVCTNGTITFNIPTSDPNYNNVTGVFTIKLTSGELVIAQSLTITGPNAASITVARDSAAATGFRVFSITAGTVSISNLTVSGGTPATGNSGGGLFVTGGTTTITGMLFTGNTVVNGSGGGLGVSGAGSTLNVINTTVSGNTATNGGGLYNGTGGTLNLTSVTITGNNSNGDTGTGACPAAGSVNGEGAIYASGGTPTLKNTIVAGNTACNTAVPDISGTVNPVSDYNLVGVCDLCVFTGTHNQVGTSAIPLNALLDPLANNGGPTKTHALQTGSPALEKGNSFGLTTDQRGFSRPVDSAAPPPVSPDDDADIGAYEQQNKPAAPGKPDLQAASDTGASNTDDVTNDTTPTFDIAGVTPGAVVELLRDGNPTTPATTGIASGTTISLTDNTISCAGVCVYSYSARQTVGGAPTSDPSAALSVTIDTTAPAAPGTPDLQPTSDTGTSNTDDITNAASRSFDIAGVTSGNLVELLRNGTPVASTTAAGASVTLTDTGSPGDGTYAYSSRQTNPTGTSTSSLSSLNVTIDTIPPASAPATPDLQAGSDSGVNTDNITNAASRSFDIAGTLNGTLVELYRDGNLVASITGNGATVVLTDTTTPGDGTYAYTARHTDVAGNFVSSAALNVTIDTTATTPTTPDLQAASDSGASNTDNVTNSVSRSFDIASTENGALVELYRDATFVASTTGNGATVTLIDTTPGDGTFAYTTKQTDVAGNAASSLPLNVTLDTAAPAPPPATPDLQAGSDTGASDTDNITGAAGSRSFDLSFTAEAGSTVTLLRNGTPVGTSTSGASSPVTLTDPDTLSDGTYAYATRHTDLAGNSSASAAALNVTIDTTAPTVASVVRLNPASATTNAASVDFSVTFSEPVTSVDTGDFALTTTGGITTPSVTGVSGSGSTYTVTVNTGSGDGTLRLDVVNDNSIKDVVNLPLAAGFTTGQVYIINRSAPIVTSIVRFSPNPTGAANVDFTVTFNKSVTGVDATDFFVTTAGLTGSPAIGPVIGSGSTYTVTVSTGTGTTGPGPYTLRLDLRDDDSIQDLANDKLGGVGIFGSASGDGSHTGDEFYDIDKTVPTVTSLTKAAGQADPATGPTNSTIINFTVVFSEPVLNFTNSSVNLSGTANPTVANVSGSGSTYNIAVEGMNASGTVIVTIPAGAAFDAAGNPNTASGSATVNYVKDDFSTFQVNTIADTDDGACDPLGTGIGNKDCTLREAITLANADGNAETITFDSTVFAAPGPYVINLGSALPDITGDATITGPGANVLSVKRNVATAFTIFRIGNNSTVNISGLTIINGNGSAGGGILVGLNGASLGTLTLTNVAITGSTSTATEGGGGIYILSGATVNVIRSTISGNHAPGASLGGGGGIYNAGQLTVVNSTISGNDTSGNGGGIISVNTTTLTNSTVASNTANQGGGVYRSAGTVTLKSTIIGDNVGTSSNPDVGPNGATFNSEGFNLIENATGVTINQTQNVGTNITGQDPALFPLADNGGPTQTHALQCVSKAIDKGSSVPPSPLATLTQDQRGLSRKFDLSDAFYPNATGGDGTDIGALETQTGGGCVPVAIPPSPAPSTNEDTQVTITLKGTYSQNSPLTFVITQQPTHGSTLTPAGTTCTGTAPNNCTATVSYTPTANYNGPDDFKFKVSASGLDSEEADVPITVNPVNDAPVANNASAIIDEDTATTITVFGTDAEGDPLSFSTVAGPSHGSLGSFSAPTCAAGTCSATILYTPTANYNGPDSFTFRVNDGSLNSVTAGTVSITLNAVPDPPSNIALSANTVAENSAVGTNVGNFSSSDPDANQTFTYSLVSGTGSDDNASFTITGNTLKTAASFDFETKSSYSVLVRSTGDQDGLFLDKQFTVNVTNVNEAPVNTVPAAQSTAENFALVFSSANGNLISIADVDAGSNPVKVTLTATNGTLTLSGTTGLTVTGNGTASVLITGTLTNINNALNGMSFTPTAGYSGAATLQIVTDDQGNTGSGSPLSDTDTLNITVLEGGTLAFNNATYTVAEGAGTASITITRTGGSAGTATVLFSTSNGTALAGQDYTTVSQTVTFNNG
ncbi:MAG: trimeric autotransporter adhesin, partial [Acidobacteriota bacterium]|nr:trimeric autotransporter adhesin [Acidobacteriota bacterium]